MLGIAEAGRPGAVPGGGQAEERLGVGREHAVGVTGSEAGGGDDVADGAFEDGPVLVGKVGKTAYVANQPSSTVTPINLTTSTPGKPIKIGQGWDSGFEAIVIVP